jgi:putative (di)nucleoside polyphosphate hydrolase
MNKKHYRQGSLGVFINTHKQILACQRSDNFAWQLPQGGREEGESAEKCLLREMQEELGTENFIITSKLEDPICYDFPLNFNHSISEKYLGQCLNWFCCKFKDQHLPDFSKASSKEFVAYKWVESTWLVENIVSWKKVSYKKGLSQLGLL